MNCENTTKIRQHAMLRTTLNGEFSSAADESRRTFSRTNLTLKQRVVLSSYLRDHQTVFPCANRRQIAIQAKWVASTTEL